MNVMLTITLTVSSVLNSCCSAEESVDLCGKDNKVSYDNYTTIKSENCGCQKNSLCLRKCCRNGFNHYHDENFFEGQFESACIKHNYSNSTSFRVPIYEGTEKKYDLQGGFIVGMLECGNKEWQYFKMNNFDPREKFYIQANGSLFYPYWNRFYNTNRFCVDEEDGLTVYLCYTEDVGKFYARYINSLGMIISMPFLLVTFLVYLIIPEPSLLRKALMSYVLSLLLAYIFLATVQLYPGQFGNIICQFLGYSIIFFFLMSFFWMNVMCLEIFLSFSKRKFAGIRRFSFYFCYAVGFPILHVGIVFLTDEVGDPDAPYYPGVGVKKCFLNDNLPNLLYYYIPPAVLVSIDVVLFLTTVKNIQVMKKELHAVKQFSYEKSTENQKESVPRTKNPRFKTSSLCWKLFFAMGINWTMEVILWAVLWKTRGNVPTYIWYLTDFCNMLYGVFLFAIFVCRKNIWKALKRWYENCNQKHPVATHASFDKKINILECLYP